MSERSSVVAGGVIAALGSTFVGVHLFHAIEEFGKNLTAIVYGVILPVVISLAIIVGGYLVASEDWADVSPWRMVKWCSGGLLVGLVLISFLVQYQAAEGGVIEDQIYVIAMFATYGSAGGLLLGWYEVRIQAQRTQLQRKVHRLDEFASIVSHDLRNPLAVAQSQVRLARETSDLSYLASVIDAFDRMEQIIKETLTVARQGEDALTLEPVSLTDVATESWDLVETQTGELEIETDLHLRADRERLKAVFENLFRNAATHNEGDVTVTVGKLDDGFYVADDGVGIRHELREKIFEAGFSTEERGTGLGLAIVRAAVDAHNWMIVATESGDGGARFEITGVEAKPITSNGSGKP